MYSISNLFFSFAKETVLPNIPSFLRVLVKKVGRKPDAETVKEQEP
jgi:hypothetical protein